MVKSFDKKNLEKLFENYELAGYIYDNIILIWNTVKKKFILIYIKSEHKFYH